MVSLQKALTNNDQWQQLWQLITIWEGGSIPLPSSRAFWVCTEPQGWSPGVPPPSGHCAALWFCCCCDGRWVACEAGSGCDCRQQQETSTGLIWSSPSSCYLLLHWPSEQPILAIITVTCHDLLCCRFPAHTHTALPPIDLSSLSSAKNG